MADVVDAPPPAAAPSPAAALRPVTLIFACTPAGGIGLRGALPWSLPADMAFFRERTLAVSAGAAAPRVNAVVMGRRTWASIPARFRPLKGRLNVVLSRAPEAEVRAAEGLPDEVLVAPSLAAAVALLSAPPLAERVETIFVIGGAAAYAEALAPASEPASAAAPRVVCDTIYVTRVLRDFECDAFVPLVDEAAFALVALRPRQSENGVDFQFATFRNRALHGLARSVRPSGAGAPPARHEEHQYLDAIRDIIATGLPRDDRTGTGTISKFGMTSRWSLRDDVFPLLTTKRVFWRGVAEELLWFISGDTNARTLQDKNVRIWDGNGSREFLDKSGLAHREVGDLGPVYGFQWRHFGAAYSDMHADYSGRGFDQLAEVVRAIRTRPDDRRIILSAWNPAALKEMALPPCHMMAQFYVAGGELFCQMYQRSGDMGLGVPFNIASYALLTRMLAQVCGLRAGEFVHVLGDAHVYKNHVEPLLAEQVDREPRPFPTLKIDPSVREIDDFRFEHFTIVGYDPHPPVKMEMAV
jgi:dihydrofolate reductase/thymidylate synthase